MAVYLAVGVDVFDGVLLCAVRSGTELSRFLRIISTYSNKNTGMDNQKK